jgi:hypothetical protein
MKVKIGSPVGMLIDAEWMELQRICGSTADAASKRIPAVDGGVLGATDRATHVAFFATSSDTGPCMTAEVSGPVYPGDTVTVTAP